MSSCRSRRGFTLLELLIVIGIIGILLGIVLAGVMRVREAAARAESQNNLKQIALAIHQFADVHKGRLPTVGDGESILVRGVYYPGVRARALLVRILPYVEQENVYENTASARWVHHLS